MAIVWGPADAEELKRRGVKPAKTAKKAKGAEDPQEAPKEPEVTEDGA